MEDKILDQGYRKKILDEMRGTENDARKLESKRQVEIFNDRIYQHVWDRLRRNFSENTLKEMPVTASINLARRIAKQEASIYKNPPKREFVNVSDAQKEVLELIYKDMGADSKFMKSNESFKLQNQNHIMVVPKGGKICMRVLRNHHLDSIPYMDDPETSSVYIIGSYDVGTNLVNRKRERGGTGFQGRIDQKTDLDSDRRNQMIGDPEDYQNEKWVWWSNNYNFITDGEGNIISVSEEGDEKNYAEINPVVDYWVRQGESLSEFTVEYNVHWSNVAQIVMMQGFAQAYLKAPQDMIPDNIHVGPNSILKLPIDKDNPTAVEFGYASPNPDLTGTIAAGESLLANFLSSRGLDPALVSGKAGGKKYGSGIERLLGMIENFEASKADYDTYKVAEKNVFQVVKAWYNALQTSDLLDNKYKAGMLSEDADIEIEFSGPEMIQSEKEKLENYQMRMDMGIMSAVEIIQEDRGVDSDTAKEILEKIEEDEYAVKQNRVDEDSESQTFNERNDSRTERES